MRKSPFQIKKWFPKQEPRPGSYAEETGKPEHHFAFETHRCREVDKAEPLDRTTYQAVPDVQPVRDLPHVQKSAIGQ